jgi:hypothetical protein
MEYERVLLVAELVPTTAEGYVTLEPISVVSDSDRWVHLTAEQRALVESPSTSVVPEHIPDRLSGYYADRPVVPLIIPENLSRVAGGPGPVINRNILDTHQ